ncbi:glycoside hydrolase family 28 protein [Rhizosphaericola mali]|uniref:Glycoside hydrolase family 28 protein n=1 Tax=Rhizosphaericola mali TaxID=2545455 RepID=A0A5P2G0U4_9BACT|nr:glycoside hydrolase family 28 protein [Rhizosphaericola mali]QES88807.1 glycoside hydrolase family 28 protein [Rhizosphaericola mali]
MKVSTVDIKIWGIGWVLGMGHLIPQPIIKQPTFKKDTINILKNGAVADGLTLNTKSIQKSIDDCSLQGGGVVNIPTGLWLTGPIKLKSNVNLHLEANAVLLFTKDFNQYSLVQGNWEGIPAWRNQSPISGTDLQNIAITGCGIIDGNGDAWRMIKKDKLTDAEWKEKVKNGGVLSADGKTWYPSEKSIKGSQTKHPGKIESGKTAKDYEDIKDYLRPNLLVLTNCNNVLLEDFTIENSPAWTTHTLMTNNLIVRNITVKNPWNAQNSDGIDVESCKNVLIENSRFDVGDDGICIKSGRDEEGRKRGVPTENVIVRNNIVYHAHGGFVIGSEMSGGAKNIWVSDCSFIGTDIGLRFKTTRGRGGIVENIHIKNITMTNIQFDAILFDMYYMAKDPKDGQGDPTIQTYPVTDATPQFKNFDIENVVVNGAKRGIFMRGLPEMNIKNIQMKNMTIQASSGIECTEAQNISISNLTLLTSNTDTIIWIDNSSHISFNNLKYPANTKNLFSLTGPKTKAIIVSNTEKTNTNELIKFGSGVPKDAITFSK